MMWKILRLKKLILIKKLVIHRIETSSKEFLEKARTVLYEEAEDDAIELRQMLADYTKLQEILHNL